MGNGDRFLIGVGATGDWSGRDNQVAYYNYSVLEGGSWTYFIPNKGHQLYVEQTDELLYFNGTAWINPLDDKEYVLTAGTGISIDRTDPDAPVISATGGGVSEWGDITGTLADQTDLQSALDDKEYVLTAGTGISIDRTDPDAPVISATGGGGDTFVDGGNALTIFAPSDNNIDGGNASGG